MEDHRTQPLVVIIVLNWNGCEDTLRCVASLEQQSYGNFSITVVDNGSTDGSRDALRALGSRVTLISNHENLGFTGGNNPALRDAFARGAEYVWLFNNDAEADRDALARLVAVCEADPRVGLASPVIRESGNHDEVQVACGRFDVSVPVYEAIDDLTQVQALLASDPDSVVLVGTALLIRRSLFAAIGELDDRFFAYWEDVDYSIRSARAGFRAVPVFDAAIFHAAKPFRAPGSIRPYYFYYMARNETLMWKKYCDRLPFFRSVWWNVLRQLRQIERLPGYRDGVEAALAGVWDGWRGVGGRYDPARRMPWPLRWMLARHSSLWLKLFRAGQ